ncbi:MAG: YdcF family protein [Chloroflexi bacterium]|nr:YdcF family protein [Chloroflexota bacterium]
MLHFIGTFFLQFIKPLGFIALLLFITLFLIRKKPKTAIWFVLICLIIIFVFGNPFFSTFMTRSMEWRYMPSQDYAQADAILLFADGTLPADTPRQRVELEGEADRVLYTAQLYHQELAPVIIVSGDFSRASSSKTFLMELGVPEDAIILQNQSSNMRSDAALSGGIMSTNDFESVLLVTSALQMDRAMFLFRDVEINITPAPTDYKVTLKDWEALTGSDWKTIVANLLPTTEALDQTARVLWEYFGLAFYRVRSLF